MILQESRLASNYDSPEIATMGIGAQTYRYHKVLLPLRNKQMTYLNYVLTKFRDHFSTCGMNNQK